MYTVAPANIHQHFSLNTLFVCSSSSSRCTCMQTRDFLSLISTILNHCCQYSDVTFHVVELQDEKYGFLPARRGTDRHLRLHASLKCSLWVIRVNWRSF